MRRKWQLLGVSAAVGAAASLTLVFTIGAGALSSPPRVPGLPGLADTAAPDSATALDLGRIQPRRFANTDYQDGGTGLRNQAEGGITINGVTGAAVRAFLWWAVVTDGPPVAGTYDTIRLQRLNPFPQTSTTGVGTIVGQGASPCWPEGDTITVYERAVSTSVAGGNGFYRVTFPNGGGSSTAGEDPFIVSVPAPLLEGASLAILYEASGETDVYSKATGGGPALSGNTLIVPGPGGFTYRLAIPPNPGGPMKFDEIGADGQSGDSRTALSGAAGDKTSINGTLVAGPGSTYNDSDWNGSDSRPIPQLWDTHGHDITGLVPSGSNTINVAITANDCITTVANLVHLAPPSPGA